MVQVDVDTAATRPAGPVSSLTARERQQLLVEWNATERPYPTGELMHELVERQARRRPDAIAVMQGDHVLSYRGLEERARCWAGRLRAAGAGPEAMVGVHLARTAEMVAVLLGVLKSGAAYVPLDPAYPRERLEFMAEDSGMTVLVTDQPLLALRYPVVILRPDDLDDDDKEQGAARPPDPAAATAENTAYVLYTSGSTGQPKGVLLSHANACDLLHWSAEAFAHDLDRVLATTSLCFDCSILEIFAPLSWGGTTVLADNALDVATLAVGHGVRLMHTVPSVMSELVRVGRLPSTVGTVLLGGEAPWPRLVDDVYRRTGVEQLLNMYGPTECTSYATMAVIDRGSDETPPIGRPVANTVIRLLDADGQLLPVGHSGELYIGGRGVTRGYLGRPGLTAERFVPDAFATRPGERLYRTGDLARYDHTGVLTFLGRVDNQVKVRGVRVEPGEVERALLTHSNVVEAAVIAPDDGQAHRRLVAYLVVADQATVTPEELREYVGDRLPAALVPDAFVVLPSLPRMPNGKIDRANLTDAGMESCARQPYVAPRDELETLLASLWAAALEVERVGVFDNFYELGGQSLAAMRVRAQIADTRGIDVPVQVMFQRQTVASLAEGVRSLAAACASSTPGARQILPPARSDGRDVAPLSPNQRAVLARVSNDPADPTLHLPLCVRLQGDLRVAALAASVTELVRRHDVLRAVLRTDASGETVQVVTAPVPIGLPMVDLTGLPAANRTELARELSVHAAQRRFELDRPPALHAVLFRMDRDDHALAVTLHQFAGDVWSMEATGHQLMALYAAAAEGRRSALIPPPVQYPDWARWQVEWSSSTGLAERRYWLTSLVDRPTLTLPTRGPRVPSAHALAHSHDFFLDRDLVEGLNRIAREDAATLHVVLLAAYQVVLGQWSGQTDLIVGCPVSGRIHPDLESTIGPFVNALPIRADLDLDRSFRDLLLRARDALWAAFAHQEVPFADLVVDLDADRDPTRHPVYQASLALHYLAKDGTVPTGLSVTDFGRRPPPTTALDVEMVVYVGEAGAAGAVTYRTDLFEADDIARFANAYVELLEAVARDPDREISELVDSAAG